MSGHYEERWLAAVRRAEAAEEALRTLYFTPGPPSFVQRVVRSALGEYASSWLGVQPSKVTLPLIEEPQIQDTLHPEIVPGWLCAPADPECTHPDCSCEEIDAEQAHEARAQAMEP